MVFTQRRIRDFFGDSNPGFLRVSRLCVEPSSIGWGRGDLRPSAQPAHACAHLCPIRPPRSVPPAGNPACGAGGRDPEEVYARSSRFNSRRFPLHPSRCMSCYREIPALFEKEIVARGHQAFLRRLRGDERASSPALRIESDRRHHAAADDRRHGARLVGRPAEARLMKPSPILREFTAGSIASASRADRLLEQFLSLRGPPVCTAFDRHGISQSLQRSVLCFPRPSGTGSCSSCRRRAPRCCRG